MQAPRDLGCKMSSLGLGSSYFPANSNTPNPMQLLIDPVRHLTMSRMPRALPTHLLRVFMAVPKQRYKARVPNAPFFAPLHESQFLSAVHLQRWSVRIPGPPRS